ncbi:large conductance mechanosensitive channel protein MscL [Parasphingorhabdus pacifica]
MLKGFKDFLTRGNVVELAVAVVIGTAFTAVVTAFTGSIVKPMIALAGGTGSQGLGFRLHPDKPATFVDLSTAINAVITFLITAAVVYFLFVLPLQRIQERRKQGVVKSPTAATDVELLGEIRNLLRSQQGLPALDATQLASEADASTTTGTGSTGDRS